MAHYIAFGEQEMLVNNRNFDNMFTFALEVGEASELSTEEQVLFAEFKNRWNDGFYWSGRGLDLPEDFPSVVERKMWARLLLDTAQAIFEREVGVHNNSAWQTILIHQLHALAALLAESVRDTDKNWWPETRAVIEGKRFLASLRDQRES